MYVYEYFVFCYMNCKKKTLHRINRTVDIRRTGIPTNDVRANDSVAIRQFEHHSSAIQQRQSANWQTCPTFTQTQNQPTTRKLRFAEG